MWVRGGVDDDRVGYKRMKGIGRKMEYERGLM